MIENKFDIKPLKDNFNLKVLSDTLNEAFSDYVIKFVLNEELLSQKIKAEDISINLSSSVYDENKSLVGFILHAADDNEKPTKLYNSVTGVVPSARGRRLVEEQYKAMVPKLREDGIKSVVLECIDTNERAAKVYNRCGFKVSRVLESYKGDLDIKPLEQYLNKDINIVQVTEWSKDLENFLKTYSEVKPSWSNTTECIKREFNLNKNKCWVAFNNSNPNEIVGMISVCVSNKRIRHTLVHPNYRNKNIATNLVYKMVMEMDEPQNVHYTVSNIEKGKGDPLINFYTKRIGLPHFVAQNEMELLI
ncbi:hypothetical protein DICPUDRAFT_77757 [Dictyostelium purpureum]|uniref:N-acetyltransferase domain-containing protein n=1 Tax=Dictyostelium purpureum TaxID=5786 RepID=F0ZHI6_DICPU|nr:uncharacterized protein DICPUDRAFT_77757 [Dictyostelium purpureum]EGC36574.1 hypothetical protein DICPUDRAFT_77757 [Dictyostelium purpureum]|eukprot:XP_003286878.1 hypothetical protein DICPUDRAFT_77757 [Dictyostelium purpureum]